MSVSHPRYLNLRGRLPRLVPPTFAQVSAVAENLRARGFRVSVTADCKLTAHDVCQPAWDRRTRTPYCQRGDIRVWWGDDASGLSPEPCAEHAAAVAAV